MRSWISRTSRFAAALTAIVSIGIFWPHAASAADAVPPTTPGNFQATVVSGDPAVTLTWSASTDASGIKAYRIDRSLDQAGWKTLSDSITGLTYRDTTSGFGLHYYYRLSATDVAGNMSGWANADVAVEDAATAATGSSEATYTSNDKRVVAQLPAGLAAAEISCNITDLPDANGQKPGTKKQPAVLGPYKLECKTAAGSVVTEYKKPVSWG